MDTDPIEEAMWQANYECDWVADRSTLELCARVARDLVAAEREKGEVAISMLVVDELIAEERATERCIAIVEEQGLREAPWASETRASTVGRIVEELRSESKKG